MPRLIAVVVLLVLVACSSPIAGQDRTPTPTCAEQAATFINEIQPLAQKWDDAAKQANNTPRESLPPKIASLESIRRDAQNLKPPPCAKAAQDKLIASMDHTIQAFSDSLAQKPESTVAQSFQAANEAMKDYAAEMALLAPPLPPVPPTPTP